MDGEGRKHEVCKDDGKKASSRWKCSFSQARLTPLGFHIKENECVCICTAASKADIGMGCYSYFPLIDDWLALTTPNTYTAVNAFFVFLCINVWMDTCTLCECVCALWIMLRCREADFWINKNSLTIPFSSLSLNSNHFTISIEVCSHLEFYVMFYRALIPLRSRSRKKWAALLL